MPKITSIFTIVLFMIAFSPVFLFADLPPDDVPPIPPGPTKPVVTMPIKGIVNLFHDKSTEISNNLKVKAEDLLKLTFTLSMALFGISVVMNRTTIVDAFSSFVMMLLFAGFVLAVIRNYNEWTMQIIDGFLNLAGPQADKSPLEIGLDLVATIWNKISITSPADSVGYVILGAIILISFALMTAKMVFVQCEAYFLVGVSIILLGLGGLTHTKDYAINVMRYCLSVAFKLFVMQMLINLGMSMFQTLIAAQEGDLSWETLGVYIFAAIILLALTYSIPEAAAGVINGSHVGSGHALIASAAAVGGAVYSAMKAANKTTVAGSRSFSSIQEAAKMAQMDGMKGFGQVAWGTVSNLMDANSSARRSKNAMGSVGQRMNSALKEGVAVLQKKAEIAASGTSPKQKSEQPEQEE